MIKPASPPLVHIDLIEDHQAEAYLIQLGLKGYLDATLSIRHFAHPGEYLAVAEGPLFPGRSLVLSDFHMPGMTGLELLAFIRHTYTPAMLPVFIMSGADLSPAEVRHIWASGANGFFAKPVEINHWEQLLANEMLPALTDFP